ncbi:hypothetical protein VTH06DRAFT_5819 [Thermothelomyces fergusii]
MPTPSNRSRGDDVPPPPGAPASSPSSPGPGPDPQAASSAPLLPQAGLGFDAGILPAVPPDGSPPSVPDKKPPASNAATGASAAGVRALTAQAVAFYFRAPVKAFFRTRVDYLAYARALQEQRQADLLHHGGGGGGGGWLRTRLRSTTPAVLASAVRHYGWRVVPDQILPPLAANVAVGPLGRRDERRWPRGRAGGGGGAAERRPRSMWAFSADKLREIGVRGVFSGWGLSLLKDSMGSAVFFSVFEYVKAQAYYSFVRWYYGSLNEDAVVLLSRKRPAPPADGGSFPSPSSSSSSSSSSRDEQRASMPTIIRPHYALEPAFLLLAGMGASVTQQLVLHPLSHIQAEHWERLEGLDAKARKLRRRQAGRMWRAYRDAYRTTWAECASEARAARLSMRRWLYRGFWWNTIRQVPSTSAGLIIFELVRRKYGLGEDQVRINLDGYDILLR